MNFAQFIKDNLVGGYQSGTWSEFQVNIFAMNYLMRGNITQEDFDEIQAVLYPEDTEEVEAILNDYMAEPTAKG